MTTSVFEKLKATDRLPSPSGVALELLHLADDEETTASTIAPVVESDPAIASRLLRMANSPVGGYSRSIGSVRQAVQYLGLRTVKIIALAFSLASTHREGQCTAFDYDRFWSDSLARGATVRHLGSRLKLLGRDEGFTLGLLSQVGRLALASVFPQRYAEVLNNIKTDDAGELAEAETCVFGIHPDDLTADMVRNWGLPETFSEALRARTAHDTDDLVAGSPSQKLSQTVQFSSHLARVFVERKADLDHLSVLTQSARQLGIAPDEFETVFSDIAEEWQGAGGILDVSTRHVPKLTMLYALADERRNAAMAEEAKKDDEANAAAASEAESVDTAELDHLRTLAARLPELQVIFDGVAGRHAEVVGRHERELSELNQRHASERDPIDAEYGKAHDELLEVRQASHRVGLIQSLTPAGSV